MHKLPPHYRRCGGLFDDLRGVSERRWLIAGNLLALLPLGAAVLVLWLPYQVYAALGAPWALFGAPHWSPIGYGAFTLLALLVTMPLHEGIHGLTLRALGYGTRLNMQSGYLFASCAPDEALTRGDYVTMALAPLVLITLGGGMALLILPAALGQGIVLALLLNAAASVGDLAVTQRVLRCAPEARFMEQGYIVIYLPDAEPM